jgi:hypothetical protein
MKHGDLVRPLELDWGVGIVWKEFPEIPEMVDVLFRVEYQICGYTRHDTCVKSFHKSRLELINAITFD